MLKSTEILQIGTNTILMESASLQKLSTLLNKNFSKAVEDILKIKGRVVITGIGKSAIIAQKIVATFNSTGTPALYMHAADAIHGDLGMIQQDDLVICISKSGNSPEIKALAPLITKNNTILIGMVGNLDSYLAYNSTYILDTTVDAEACPHNLAPTTSTTAQMAMGDALAVALIKCRDFKSDDFAKYHPGGALGKKLYLTLGEMAQANARPSVSENASLSECILAMTKGRLGAVLVTKDSALVGIITDGDIRRMLSKTTKIDELSAAEIMSINPKAINVNAMAVEALEALENNSITQILVTDNNDNYVGVVHLHDLIKEGIF